MSSEMPPPSQGSTPEALAPSSTQQESGSKTPVEGEQPETPKESTATSSPSTKAKEKLELGNVRPLTFDVWKHFKRQKVDDVWKAICEYCKKQLSGNTKNGTSHLNNHWKVCPLRNTRDIKQTMLDPRKERDGHVTLRTNTFDQGEARKELASMICLHEYPLSMVEHVGFRRFTNAIQPLFKPVARNTIKKDIFAIYDFEKAKTMSLLEANKCRVAITTDMWTSSNQKRGFMAVTAHFVDESWVLQNRIIRFIYVPHPHTAEDLSNELVDALVDWNIDRKLSTVTLDNCSTNDAMIPIIVDKLSEKHLLLDGKMMHMRCCAHILNLIVKDGLEMIGDAIEKIRDSVAYWKATPKRDEEFERMARQLKVPTTKKLILDCKTRWNSTYLMLSVALGYQEVFPRMKLRDKRYMCLPSESDWKLAKEICEKLKLFYVVSELFSGTAYPTANEYFPRICQIKIELTNWRFCENVTISSMAESMLLKFDKYWSEVNSIMAIATVLDPRFKMKLIEFFFPTIYGERASGAIASVKQLCYELFEAYASIRNSGSGGDQARVTANTYENVLDQLSQYDAFVEENKSTTPEKSELDKYLSEGVKQRTPDFDVLAWWKVNARDYPTLALIARDVLAIPVSTVASESAFSTSGRFVSPHRSRLHPKKLEALMCAQDWLWAEIKGSSSSGHVGCCTFFEDMEDEEGDVPTTKA